MNKYEDFPTGFTTTKEINDVRWIACNDHKNFWHAILNGYKQLMRSGLAELINCSASEKDADDVLMLYLFMEDLETKLAENNNSIK